MTLKVREHKIITIEWKKMRDITGDENCSIIINSASIKSCVLI